MCYQPLFLLWSACSGRRLGLGLFCFVLLSSPNFCEQSTVWGREEEKPNSSLGKVDPTTTQITVDATALACVQFKF